MRLDRRLRRALLRMALPPAVEANHVEYSMIASSEDEAARPTERLLTLAVEAVAATRGLRLTMTDRAGRPIPTINHWPGEHYRLLAGLVAVLQPKLIIEIGTGSGGSAMAMKQTLSREGRIVTYDLIDWRVAPEGILHPADFEDGRLAQSLDDVSRPEGFAKHRALFEQADLFFIDAAKDGRMEQRLLDALSRVAFRADPLLVFDDIRVWNMLKIWRGISAPKLDVTSFGHWTGTGFVEGQFLGVREHRPELRSVGAS